MADIWENSAVMALRDLQWLFARNRELPEAGVNLSGNAEGRLGDSALKMGGRFFLLEIKAQSSNFPSEWKEKKRKDGEVRAKHAYLHAIRLVKEFSERPSDEQRWANVIASLRCHHFAYWHVGLPSAMHSRLSLQPYLFAVAKGSAGLRGITGAIHRLEERLSLAYGDRLPDDHVSYYRARSATVSGIYYEKLGIVKSTEGGNEWFPLGLSKDDFQGYINSLMKGAKGGSDKLNLVAISSRGWYRPLKTTQHLASLLDELSRAPVSSDTSEPDDLQGRVTMDSRHPCQSFAEKENQPRPLQARWMNEQTELNSNFHGPRL
jgi:hypothetical protein